jgi:4-hydroxybenzoate polyprenyltransferase
LWSLDVVIGALATGYFFTKIMEITMPSWWWVILSGSVWVMYTVDHLLDGIKIKNMASVAIFRHFYHAENKKILAFVVLLVSTFILIIVVIAAPAQLLKEGLFLVGLITLYFLVIHFTGRTKFFLFQKELTVAVIYVTGILLGPLTLMNGNLELWQNVLIIAFILLTWAEGIMASWYDYENDLHDGHNSFATLFGLARTKLFLIFLHSSIFLLLLINLFWLKTSKHWLPTVILGAMNGLVLFILLKPELFRKNERFRILGEMIFWVPFVLLLF